MNKVGDLDIMTEFKSFLTDKGFNSHGADEVIYRIENDRPDREDMSYWKRFISSRARHNDQRKK